MSNTTHMEDYELSKNYEDLAIAIIQQAVMDYEREYFKTLKQGYWTNELRKLNTFFNSRWAAYLSFGKAKEIRDRVKAEVEEKFKNNANRLNSERVNHRVRLLSYNGESKSIKAWSKDIGISATAIAQRLKYGWSVEKALSKKRWKKGE